MTENQQTNKGAVLEEALRAFFLRAGFFVVRGVPLRIAEEDLTDVDLWLYERPTGTSRRVQICDIKYKQRPKAVERIFWTSGLAKALGVDDAYVATTDKRKSLRAIAAKLDLQLIDGNDIQRIVNSPSTLYPGRIGDEELLKELQEVDGELRGKFFQDGRIDVLSALSDGFGAASAVRSLENLAHFSRALIGFHPDTATAKAAIRLAYLAGSLACQSLDYVSIGAAFRSLEERHDLILQAVRAGALSNEKGQQSLKLALALVEKYSPGGKATATAIERNLRSDLEQIPAEIVAEQAIRLLNNDKLFNVGRELEMAAYQQQIPSFDRLSIETRSMLGAMLDYGGIDRERFANAWTLSKASQVATIHIEDNSRTSQPQLFND